MRGSKPYPSWRPISTRLSIRLGVIDNISIIPKQTVIYNLSDINHFTITHPTSVGRDLVRSKETMKPSLSISLSDG